MSEHAALPLLRVGFIGTGFIAAFHLQSMVGVRNVAVTEGDKTEAELRFGVSINTWGVNDLVAAVESQSEADVDALKGWRRQLFGEDALKLKRGEIALVLNGARVEVVEIE